MGLMSALQNAMSGLGVSQAQIDLISRNVANASTPGYTRRVLDTRETYAGGITAGAVRQAGVNRILDQLLQKQLRAEAAGATYSSAQASFLKRLDQSFGTPGSSTGLSAVFAGFSTALQQLAADPASSTMQANVIGMAKGLTSALTTATNTVQGMRGEIEATLANDTQHANDLLKGIEATTKRLNEVTDSASQQSLLDERDRYIDELSSYFDIRTVDNGRGNFNIYTTGGAPLFIEGRSLRLAFNDHSAVSATSTYNADPKKSGLGQLTIQDSIGGAIDLTNTGLVRSGSFAALFNLRDQILPESQKQLDEFAAALSKTLSDRTVPGTAVTAGAQAGFTLDLNALKSGNTVTFDYVVQPGGTKQRVSFVAVNSPSALPLKAGATADPNDLEVGIDFSAGIPAAIAAIGTALGAPFSVSDLGGGVMQVLDDGAGNTRDIAGLSASVTNTATSGQGVAFPFFVDSGANNGAYTGSFDQGSQLNGFAGRIVINPALLSNPSLLVGYQPGLATGDSARPNFLRDQLQSAVSDFSPATALTGATTPYRGTLSQFLDRAIAIQSQAASSAQSLSEGQGVVLSALQDRAAQTSGVDKDQELGNLIEIQNIYSANARLVSAVKDMFDMLMRI